MPDTTPDPVAAAAARPETTDADVDTVLAEGIPPKPASEEKIDKMIARREFQRLGETITVCLITLTNGMELLGSCTCGDPEGYVREDEELRAFRHARSKVPFVVETERRVRHAVREKVARRRKEARRAKRDD